MEDGPDRVGWIEGIRGDAYDVAFDRLAARGKDVHGEAAFVEQFHPCSVLDAGCGTGRVARELAHRSISTAGIDIDPDMLTTAQRRSPDLEWHLGDLASVRLSRTFDVVLLAGNVMIFLAPGTESAVIANMAAHLSAGGRLVAGFQLDFGLSLTAYDTLCEATGLILAERWATWQRDSWRPSGNYAVSVHRRSE